MEKRLVVLDNFYEFPDLVIKLANSFSYVEDLRYYKGTRSKEEYLTNHLEIFEDILGIHIDKDSFYSSSANGHFQKTCSEDPQVYHFDNQRWAGILYLSKNPPPQSGTKTYRSLLDNSREKREASDLTFSSGFYDSTKFECIDTIGNIFNRLVLMDGRLIHSAGPYWGNSRDSGRLVQLFFFEEQK